MITLLRDENVKLILTAINLKDASNTCGPVKANTTLVLGAGVFQYATINMGFNTKIKSNKSMIKNINTILT
jgi:hypothetical protein